MITREFDLVSPNIKGYIRNRTKYLTCNPSYFINHNSMTKNKLEEEANRHSVSIELVDFCTTDSESKKLKSQEKKRCETSLREARRWALENYSLPLSKDYVELVGSMVDPMVNDAGFRKDKVRVTNSPYSPPSPEKLNRELNIFLWENEAIKDPLEKAIHAHLGIARVHPFNDGNGRTSRLIQDTILKEKGLPLPMIPLYERPEYIQKIGDAISSHYEREAVIQGRTLNILSDLRELATNADNLPESQIKRGKYLAKLMLSLEVTPEQNAFYDFIALKVLNGLSEQLRDLYPSEKEMAKFLKIKKENQRAAHSSNNLSKNFSGLKH